jgi:hypothetical protein
MTPISPSPFKTKGVTVVQPLRGFHVLAAPPWGGPAEEL